MATTFNIYRDGEQVASDLTDTEYTDEGLTPNTDYQYQVSAQNEAGESDLSEAITVHTDFSDVESISVSQNAITLTVGDTATLTASVLPSTANPSVIWSSSDESIATVDEDGVVTAVAEGTATITAQSSADDTMSAACDVTVNAE